ncbi:MAG: hypothetical protein HRU25_11850 [Psychrobium sp.]|nr:hypothetical protein [Psychrobium sp.]
MDIVKELKLLRKERNEKKPFNSIHEFEAWADSVHPLLSFHSSYAADFSRNVTSASVASRIGSLEDSYTCMNNAIGIVNKALITAEIENNKSKETHTKKLTYPLSNNGKSVKQTFEEHPVVFGCTLLVLGFVSGISVTKFIFPPTQVVSATSPIPEINIQCDIEGLPSLSSAHDKRAESMQDKLLEFETLASDRKIIPSNQNAYLASANRVRTDIEAANNAFKAAVSQLNTTCIKKA